MQAYLGDDDVVEHGAHQFPDHGEDRRRVDNQHLLQRLRVVGHVDGDQRLHVVQTLDVAQRQAAQVNDVHILLDVRLALLARSFATVSELISQKMRNLSNQ